MELKIKEERIEMLYNEILNKIKWNETLIENYKLEFDRTNKDFYSGAMFSITDNIRDLKTILADVNNLLGENRHDLSKINFKELYKK